MMVIAGSCLADAQVSVTGPSYFENFDSMGTAGTSPPAGWSFYGQLAPDNATWTNATGIPAGEILGGTLNNTVGASTSFAVSSNVAGYNFALSTALADRCIGTSPTSGRGLVWQLALMNGTSTAFNALRMSYDIRRFTQAIDTSSIPTDNQLPGYWLFYSLDAGVTWSNVSALNPAIATGAVQVPNTPGVTSVVDVQVPLSGLWAAGSEIRLRWVDDNASETSPDQVVGLDNVGVVPLSDSGTLMRGPYLNQANESSIVVRWRSSTAVVGRVRYGTTIGSLTQSVDEAGATTEHIVRLTGLAPYSRYYYTIGSATGTLAGGDAEHTFRTSPIPGTATDTRIWVLGDAGRANVNQAAVRDAYYSWTGARTPDLCLMLGDNAYNSGTDAEYQAAVFNMYPAFLRKMPLWSCLGNHDANGGSTSSTANFPYFDMFTLPTNAECGGVVSGTERYFSFDYGNIHFINLDSQTSNRNTIEANGSDGAMAAWLRNDLAGITATWIIAFFHHPPYSKGSHNSDTETQLIEMRSRFGPILEAGGVDLVLSGHSHSYERTFFLDGHYGLSGTFTAAHKQQPGNGRPASDGAYIKPLTGPRDHFGAVYTLTGSAGSADGGALNHPAMFVSYNTLGSFNIDINGNTLNATYIESDGDIADTFTIIKQGAADSDGDGVADAFEIANGMNRFSNADATIDTDQDGNTAVAEYLFGLNPGASDRFAWTTSLSGNTAVVTFPTLPQRTYQVFWSTDLLSWNPGSAVITGDGATKQWTDSGGAGAGRCFYQVQVKNGP